MTNYLKQNQYLEFDLHNRFAKYRKAGEWFYYSDEIQNFINSL